MPPRPWQRLFPLHTDTIIISQPRSWKWHSSEWVCLPFAHAHLPHSLPLVAIGTLNRETMCFIPFTYFLYWLPKLRQKEWVWLGVSAMAWILVFAGLRVLWPADSNLTSISKSLSKNLTLSRGNLDLITILAPSILVLFRARQLPAPYLRLALCSFPWLVLHFFAATWYEIRYYMPVLIWLLPGLVFVFSREATMTENAKSVVEQPLAGDAVFRASQP